MPEPVRTCVGCRTASSKRALVRVVREVSGAIAPDPTGKAPGRGAYVHPTPACVDEALRRGALGRALRVSVDRDGAARLKADLVRVLERSQTSRRPAGRQAGIT